MDHSMVRSEATNQGLNNLSRSFNDLNCGQEVHPLKSSLSSYSGNAKEQFVSLSSIALPKISLGRGMKELNTVPVQLSSGLPRVHETTKSKTSTAMGEERMKTLPARPKSCAARVSSTTLSSSSQTTLELLRRNRKPLPSLPVAVERDKIQSAPSSPTLRRNPPCALHSKGRSFMSSQPLVRDTNFVNSRRKSPDAGRGMCWTPPMSPAFVRKFEDSDKIVRKAKNLIDDYRRSSHVQGNKPRIDKKSLAEAMEEVKNCRYLRVVKQKDDVR